MIAPGTISRAEPGDVLYDDQIHGLELRVFEKKACWYCRYRTKGGRQRRPKIGDYPTLTLSDARGIAKQYLLEVAKGNDPTVEWKRQRAAPMMQVLTDKYLEWAVANKKESSVREDRRYIERYILPKFRFFKVEEIRHNDIDEWLTRMKDTPYQANRLRACLAKMFQLAEKWEMRPAYSNPVRNAIRFKERRRRRYLRPWEALAVYQTLEKLRPDFPQAVAFIYLLIYTGARPSEIASATPDQREGNRFELREHKTSNSGNDRIIFLPPQAVAILDALPPTRDGTITGIRSPRHVWRKIIQETGIKNLRLYDLRHSFASAALMDGKTLAEIGELLGHQSAETTKRYAHLMEDAGVSRVTQVANRLEAMLKGVKRRA